MAADIHSHLSQPRQKHPQQPLSHQPSPRNCFLYCFPTLTLPKQSKHASSSLHYKVCYLSTSRPFRFRHIFRFWVTCSQKYFAHSFPFNSNSKFSITLKVPKCEIFDPFFFTSINPIWVGDLRTGEKKFFFEDHGRYWPFCFFYAG